MTSELASSVPRLKRLLTRFRKLRLAVLGDMMLDRYVWGQANRLSPEAAVPVVEYESQQDFPGGACNVAANIASLGARVEALGVVGGEKRAGARKILPDEAGAALQACLRMAGIGDRGMLSVPNRMTTLKTRIIARNHHVVRIDHERRDPLSPGTEDSLFRLLVGVLKDSDGLILSDYDKGLLADEFADRVLNAAHRTKVPVYVKPKSSHPRSLAYKGARLLVCNAKEAAHYVGRALPDEKSFDQASEGLLAHFGCAAVVITRGSQGMTILEEGWPRPLHILARNFEVTYARVGKHGVEQGSTGRQVFDVTGAGDTVLSVLSLALAAGANLQEAALLANTAAGVVVGKLGTATVTAAELAAALEEIQV
jgi:D-beta-D-heptose 7-phosphate kinase/D-beta-D-heptose 1-phosphate adenosyltransferase